MTFDELMVKYQPLIENAAGSDTEWPLMDLETESLIGDDPGVEYEPGQNSFRTLVMALEKDLAGSLEGPNLRKGAIMAAKELVSRFQLPEGSGAAHEGGFGSYSEADNLDPIDATIEAPVLVVSFGEPPRGSKVLQAKDGSLKFIPPEPQ